MTEAASQHIDGIGARTASLCKRSWSSARYGWFLVRLGFFLLKDAARPRRVSHADGWIGLAGSAPLNRGCGPNTTAAVTPSRHP